MRKIYLLILIIFTHLACSEVGSEDKTVVVTTNILGDVTQQLLEGVDSVRIEILMGPGVDPHLYKASQGDVEKLNAADLVIYNGLHLEGKMTDIFSRLRDKKTLAAAEVIPETKLINASDYSGAYDPHIWFSPELFSQSIKAIAQALKELQPSGVRQIDANLETYLEQLEQLHFNNQLLIDNIPEKQRVLITAHDAFKYFGRAYKMQVRGLQGISTTAEYGIRDVSNLVDFIIERNIKAIFVESSVPERSVEAVIEAAQSRGHDLQLGGELYSDALGDAESEADTYLKMFSKNVQTISLALK